MKTLTVVAALAAACLVAPAAQAQHVTRTQRVTHADLNLRDADDVARLDRRIARIAADLCGPVSAYDRAGMRQARACAVSAVARVTPVRDRVIAGTGVTLVARR